MVEAEPKGFKKYLASEILYCSSDEPFWPHTVETSSPPDMAELGRGRGPNASAMGLPELYAAKSPKREEPNRTEVCEI